LMMPSVGSGTYLPGPNIGFSPVRGLEPIV
jgi:hypothetical protein